MFRGKNVTDITKRGAYRHWSENDLVKLAQAYKNGDLSLNECSRIYFMPKATIKTC